MNVPALGMSLSGGFIAPGVSGTGYDEFYPNLTWPAYANISGGYKAPEYDRCMTHVDHTGFLHSHLLGGCNSGGMSNYTSYKNATGCAVDNPGATPSWCRAHTVDYGLQQWYGNQSRKPVGLAVDGHIIWSPYKDDGTLYSACEVDQCNGLYVGGYYGFALTTFLPYNVGCFGGSNQAYNVAPQCTSNGRMCSA